jgi:hypothetical protein
MPVEHTTSYNKSGELANACLPRQQWRKPQYGLMTLAYQLFTAVLLLIYSSNFLSGVYYCLSVFCCAIARIFELELEHFSVKEFLSSKQVTVLTHPPYSPDLAPSDLFLFPKIKKVLKGRYFNNIDNIKINMTFTAVNSRPLLTDHICLPVPLRLLFHYLLGLVRCIILHTANSYGSLHIRS